ncbi:MAG: type II toxin-antitoxin system death-on-curing family toxin [Candidatus Riflebacteria bacterium]|nr:type II toxin-antitoxin system death-on-curing family toxin [Candidatus Riflebacteria bacterium]
MLPNFLTLAEVLDFHEDLLQSFGGRPGIRDLALLESAVEMPQSGSDKVFFHKFPFEMAAAYAYHIVRNHAFIDGNKRTGLAAALVFLEINGYPVMGGEDALEAATWEIASGNLDKSGFAAVLEQVFNQHNIE